MCEGCHLQTIADAFPKSQTELQHCREVTGLSEEERDEQTLDRIDRRKRRAEKRGES